MLVKQLVLFCEITKLRNHDGHSCFKTIIKLVRMFSRSLGNMRVMRVASYCEL